ncbi:transposon protein, putative, CACTA, En/Spm sub-class [Cucumis melo var. makuwa]|uniref:Transposon protein, putative, CACTA, En/Spm sub-class n=1 Tax=Cucumis melo var. makuwa TaxID=1194695 RepID=A0A5A7UJL7_CUCMM|nr:transposon protein, putative, CACTA, En/Spm sub-class [Cucumis melo var. makuwa]
MGPSLDVRCYNGCIIDGVRFHTSKRDPQRTTNNSRVMVIGIMLSFSSDFEETNVIFLKLRKDLNTTGGLSLVGEILAPSTPRRRLYSELLEVERYVYANGRISISIAPSVVRFGHFEHTTSCLVQLGH